MANPTTTVAQHTALMLTWFDDKDAGYFTADNTLIWLNYAQREVQKQLILAGENYYVKPVETILVVGQADYVLPSDFLKEHKLEIILSGTGQSEVRQPLAELTLGESDFQSHDAGTPVNFYVKKDRITLEPTPDTALVMRMHYSYKIPELALTTDIPDIPEEFAEYVTLLAAFNGFIKDDMAPENLTLKIQEYKDMLKRMADDRMQGASKHVVMLEDYFTMGWI